MLFWKSTMVGNKGVAFRYTILRILVSMLANIFSETTSNNGKAAQNEQISCFMRNANQRVNFAWS